MSDITIGRIVHYRTPNGIAPAIVTQVHEPENGELEGVALHVFDPFGGSYSLMGIKEGTDLGQWSWPPQV